MRFIEDLNMPYEMRWQQEKRVISGKLYGIVTLEDLSRWTPEILRYVQEGDAPVHLIADLHEIEKFPMSISALRNVLQRDIHPKMGWVVTLGGPSALMTFSYALARLFKVNLYVADTLDEAVSALRAKDSTLNPAEMSH